MLDRMEGALDTDNDGIANYLDKDSDNDGLSDLFESGGRDNNRNGAIDNFVDNNSDGLDDGHAVLPLTAIDSDADGIPDRIDLDSDNDGLSDVTESGNAQADNNNDGMIDSVIDINQDGLADAIMPNASLDHDGDSLYNHLDIDSNNNGTPDITEAGGDDANGDGRVDSWSDHDVDGIPDHVDVDLTQGRDADNDGIDDEADADFVNIADSDGDGIVDRYDANPLGDGYISVTRLIDLPQLGAASASHAIETTSSSGAGCSISFSQEHAKDPLLVVLALLALTRIRRKREALEVA